jgi:solute carrier family 10 (sodium/bile acid cotransporter), member 7
MAQHFGWSVWFRGNWFLIVLVLVVGVGIFWHRPLYWLTGLHSFQSALVFSVMWMMASPIPFSVVRNTLARPSPGLLATAINLGLVPLLTLLTLPFLPADLGGGLIVAAAVPSTLASAAVWTRKGGGDDTVAIMVTLLTNISCVVITPLWLTALLGKTVNLDLGALMLNLLIVVVVPIALAQTMRLHHGFCLFAERRKIMLALLCQFGILIMILLGSIHMGERMEIGLPAAEAPVTSTPNATTWFAVLMATVAACLVHTSALAIAWWLAVVAGIERPQRIAVSLSGSQKTLMVGLKLAIDCGVSILPMVIYHVSQLIIDTVIVKRWAKTSAQVASVEVAGIKRASTSQADA